jgi:prepilin-type N-terminal cleavage/methylation domain-containing protein
VRREKTGFTLVELLTVLAIVAMLIGLLIPSLTMIRNTARRAKQKSQLTEIGLALTAFRNDYGDYPPSYWHPINSPDYCGAQKLAEALLGWDLLGFHPRSAWRADGYDGLALNGPLTYDPDQVRDNDVDGIPDTYGERKGPYLELATTNAFRLCNNPVRQDPDGLFINPTTQLNPDRYVICDSFGVRKITIAPGETAKAGTPILYYKANTSSKNINLMPLNNRIYDARDNQRLVELGSLTKDGTPGTPHPLEQFVGGDYPVFYDYDYKGGIRDPKVTARPWPYRPDSYILISAGADGLYGTEDDICNFGK